MVLMTVMMIDNVITSDVRGDARTPKHVTVCPDLCFSERGTEFFFNLEMEVIRSEPGHLATGCSLRNVSVVVVVAHATAGSGLSGSLEWPRLLSP